MATAAPDPALTFDWNNHVKTFLATRSGFAWLPDHLPDVRGAAEAITLLLTSGRDAPLGSTAVHGDLLVTQFLADDAGAPTGIVDWAAAGRGASAVDLAFLFLNIHTQGDRTGQVPSDEVTRKLALVGSARSPGFPLVLAYHLLAMLAFVVERNPKHVPWRSDLARRVVDAYVSVVGP